MTIIVNSNSIDYALVSILLNLCLLLLSHYGGVLIYSFKLLNLK